MRGSARQLAGLIAVALLAVVLVAPPAQAKSAKFWEGKFTYHLPHGAVGTLTLEEQSGSVKGRYFDSDGKRGKIAGELLKENTLWLGTYRNKTDEDKGEFRVERNECVRGEVCIQGFRGWFKSKFGKDKLRWSGERQ